MISEGSKEVSKMSTSTIRRVFFKRRPSNLIALALEHPVIFNIILVLYSLIAPILYESLIKVPIPRYVVLLLVVLVPGAVVIQLYLSNLSLSRRAELAVRFRSHDDTLVLSLLAEQILNAIDYTNRRITWRSRFLKRVPTKEKIRSHGIFLTFSFDHVSNHFRVSREVVEELFGTPVRVLTSRLEKLVDINLWISHNSDAQSTWQLSVMQKLAAEEEAKFLRNYMDDLVRHLNSLLKFTSDIPTVIHGIVKESSTGKAAVVASELLARYVQNIDHHPIVERLLSLRRGLPLLSLLQFEELKKIPSNGERYYRSFGNISRESTRLLCKQAADFISKNLSQGELIVTFGYSNAVAQVIEVLTQTKPQVDFQVVVIEPETVDDWERLVFEEESKLMEIRLREIPALRNRVTRYSMDFFLEKELTSRRTRIFIGAENVRSNGMVIHPRGRRHLLMRTIAEWKNSEKKCEVYVFAESYKFIELSEEAYSSSYFVTFAPGEYSFLVTDSEVFHADNSGLSKIDGSPFNFDDVNLYWKRFAGEYLSKYLKGYGLEPIFQKLAGRLSQKGATPLAPTEALSKEEHARIVAALDEVTALSQETGPPVSNRDHDAYLYGKH